MNRVSSQEFVKFSANRLGSCEVRGRGSLPKSCRCPKRERALPTRSKGLTVKYDFLVLAMLVWIPALVLVQVRPDLRKLALVMAGFSLPFALTEKFFYPHYWEPYFIGDLGARFGFGLEDFMFVSGLAIYTSLIYPSIHKQKLQMKRPSFQRLTRLGLGGIGLFITLLFIEVPILYTTLCVTGALAAYMVSRRRDLLRPALWGGVWSTVVYFGVCLVFQHVFPHAFQITWHTEQYLYLFVLGVPLEELLYAATCGAASTVFFPYIACARFRPLNGITLNRPDNNFRGRATASNRGRST